MAIVNASLSLRVLARLLAYPDAELRSHLPEMRDVLRSEQALAAARRADHFTRPYQTLLVQIFCSRTTSPLFGECQSLFLPA